MSRNQDDDANPQNAAPTGGRGGGGIGARLLIAIVLALVAFVKYMGKGDVNPITGEKQRVQFSEPKDEINLGLASMPSMVQQHGGESRNRAATVQVVRVGQRLLDAMEAHLLKKDGKKNPYEFKFHLLSDDEVVNAFALPGGQVFITEALYDKLETEGQLAGVLGHEVGHVIQRHSNQRIAKQELTQGVVGAAQVGVDNPQLRQYAAYAGNLLTMKFGRTDELQADIWGVRLSAWAGYDPRNMIGVMRILDSIGGGKGSEILSTHPKPANRIAYIKGEVLEKEFPKGIPEDLRDPCDDDGHPLKK